ncbi:MAG: hypothetical protein K0B87_00895 [Candidatus Syntrophosphaera sp.]|nr:hypothetical protein [Candidatus Syntrophosphaera sp.]
MNRFYALTALLLLVLMLLAGCARRDVGQSRIASFAAADMPFDDGTGVMLTWKPLDRSQRIIQYNIYRGHRPDSLFFLAKIEIDPTVGVASDWLNFYDKDYLTLIEFETAPGKLKQEKHQTASGTLFKAVPRDAKVLGQLLPHYDVLGDINTSKYFNSSSRVEIQGGEGPEVYAGYELTRFNNIYANPKAGHTYYYCVVPVTETGGFLPATQVLPATPVNNRPDSTAVLYTTYISDTNEFRFEWTPPLESSDISGWQAWLMPKSMLPQFRADQKANASAPDSVFHANWQSGSILLHSMYPPYWSQVFYDKVDLNTAGIKIPSPEELQNYIPVLTYEDYWVSEDGSREEALQTASLGEQLSIHASAQLPRLPDYSVLDKPNDKGDNMLISFGRSFAFVTMASYTNKAKTRMRINYEISGNGHEEIDRLRFEFFDRQGNSLGRVKENYPDKIIHFKLPPGTKTGEDFSVRVYARKLGERQISSEYISQDIIYDPTAFRFNGGDVSLGGQVLNSFYYDIFSKNKLSANFSPGMRIGALSRLYDHTIPFPATEYPAILKYDPQTGLLLTDHHFQVAQDNENFVSFSPSFYKQDFAAYLDELRAGIATLGAETATGDSLSEAAQNLKAKQAELDLILSNPAYQKAAQANGDRAWRRVLRQELDKNSRSYAYQLLATNGRGLWSDESDLPGADAAASQEEEWHYPRGEWFDKTKLATLIASILMGLMVVYALTVARRKDLYIRPIAGLEELDNAVGRATEMGRPVMFVPGWGTLGEPCTISAMMILNQIAKKTAAYDIRLISPHVDYFVVPLAQEMVQSAYNEMGRPDAYNNNDIFFVSDTQFAFCAAVNGITVRDRVATIFYMGYFYAEALLMTETGNQSGAIQIAASDAITQIPFFITTCDYTLIGEEFYAASAYLSRNIELVSMLKAQDYFKILIVISVLVGTVLSTLGLNTLLNFLPFE